MLGINMKESESGKERGQSGPEDRARPRAWVPEVGGPLARKTGEYQSARPGRKGACGGGMLGIKSYGAPAGRGEKGG